MRYLRVGFRKLELYSNIGRMSVTNVLRTISSSDTDSDQTEAAQEASEEKTHTGTPTRLKRGRDLVVTPQLGADLDQSNDSSREAVFVIS